MNRNNVLNVSMFLIILMGIVMIILGINSGPKVLIPPIITGIGFMVIAWVFSVLKEK